MSLKGKPDRSIYDCGLLVYRQSTTPQIQLPSLSIHQPQLNSYLYSDSDHNNRKTEQKTNKQNQSHSDENGNRKFICFQFDYKQ